MSLVYEALQKAEREKQRKTGVAAPSPSAPAPEIKPARHEPLPAAPVPQPARSFQPVLIGLIACVAVVALVAIVYLVSNATKPGGAASVAVTNTVITTAAAPVAAAAPASELPPLNPMDARFRITGIMRDSEGKFGAVLNGKIVYDGHYVDGATVKSIAQDRAILDVNGREVVVRLY
jgi:hypothetical protein